MRGKIPLVANELTEFISGNTRYPADKKQAFQYCEQMAKSHYENFIVASLLLPREKRQHLYNLYAFCRVSDDLADEIKDPRESLQLLQWWRNELHQCYGGKPNHLVLVALQDTISTFDIPQDPFDDLLDAFIQDQSVTRYQTFGHLQDYCRRSANPVGRLYLHLFGYHDPERQELSDCTCTALQLTNFWQDISMDLTRNRIYIPREDMERFGVDEKELANHQVNAAFCRLMHFEVARTRELYKQGAELISKVDPMMRLDLEFFTRGGMEILRLIEQNGYDVFRKRPALSHGRKLGLLLGRIISARKGNP